MLDVVARMDAGSQLHLFNGSSADEIAIYRHSDRAIDFYADYEEQVGVHKTVLQDCDNLKRLLELHLQIEVLPNIAPQFLYEPTTSFEMKMGETVTYQLPQTYDPDDNSNPIAYLDFVVG